MKFTYLIFAMLFCIGTSHAATITSTSGGGSWTTAGTWVGGVVPSATDHAIIAAGASVTVSSTVTIAGVEINGTLTLNGSFVDNGDLTINVGGSFQPASSFAVYGNFINNGTANLSRSGMVMRMTAPAVAASTTIGGSGVFSTGVVRTLRIDNVSGVSLIVPLSVSVTLALWNGAFTTGSNLTLDNTKPGSGSVLTTVTLERQHTGSLVNTYAVGGSATLSIQYTKNTSSASQLITAGNEIPVSRSFSSLTINNAAGLRLTDSVRLQSGTSALTFTAGIIKPDSGKAIYCTNAAYSGTAGTATSYVDGAVALTAGTTPADRTFPIGISGGNRKVVLRGATASTGTVTIKFSPEMPAGGTAVTGVSLSAARRWLGRIVNGSLLKYTGIGIDYGVDDSVTSPISIASSATIGGTYKTFGPGSNSPSAINTPAGVYTQLGYFALASGTPRITSTSTGGAWNSGSTWIGGIVPSATDEVIIAAGATVTTPAATITTATIQVYGILTSGGSFLINGDLTINSGGEFRPYGRSFAVNGDFTNNGLTDLSRSGTVTRLGTPSPVRPTVIGGSGVFTTGVVRTLRIDNAGGVTLSVPLSVSVSLALWRGVFNNGSFLTLDNSTPGNGSALSSFSLIRQQVGSMTHSYSLGSGATLNIQYTTNMDSANKIITAGYELPVSRTFNSITVDNFNGINIDNDIALRADTSALILLSGVVNVAAGKTIICTSVSYPGSAGSIGSYINGGVSLAVDTVPTTKIFPLGSERQIRKVTLYDIAAASDTANVRFTLLSSPGGITGSGLVLHNSKKWKGTVTSGSISGFSRLEFEYGPYDSSSVEAVVAFSSAISGTYSSMGSGTNSTHSVSTPSGTYTSLGFFALGGAPVVYSNTITGYNLLNTPVERFNKAEWDIGVSASFINPYDVAQIAVDMKLVSPTGKSIDLPCYYEEGRGLQVSKWKARFMPQEAGSYNYKFILSCNGSVVDSTSAAVFASGSSDKDGILHYDNPWTLKYDSDKPFRGIGQDIGWEPMTVENPLYTYDYMLPKIAGNGCNFFRTFMNCWNLPLEWNRVELANRNIKYKNSSEIYNPDGIKRMDELVEMSDSLNLHMMLMIEWQVNLRTDKEYWLNNPYNIANGGPASTPTEFFTSTEAKRMFKNRLRYMIARWGYSPAIGVWELMNEVDNAVYYTESDDWTSTQTDSIVIPHAAAVSWHQEMAQYLKETDPYGHIVSTSVGYRLISGLFSVPNMDFNQEHMYNRTDYIPTRLTDRLTAYSRPTVIGEFAYRYQNGDPAYWDEFNFDFKKGVWYGLFNPTPIIPINWWWVLWDQMDGYGYFKSVKTIDSIMLAAGGGSFVKTPVTATGLIASGLQCGDTFFGHLLNNDSTIVVSTPISITVDSGTGYSLQIFDPETMDFSSPELFTSNSEGIITVSGKSFDPHEQKIFIFTKSTGSRSSKAFTMPARRLSVQAYMESRNILDFRVTNKDGTRLNATLSDIGGRIMQVQPFDSGTGTSYQMKMAHSLPAGIYILTVVNNGMAASTKVIIK